MKTKQDYEIKQAIEAIRDYIRILVNITSQQTDITDKLLFISLIKELSMAIFNLQSQYSFEQQRND